MSSVVTCSSKSTFSVYIHPAPDPILPACPATIRRSRGILGVAAFVMLSLADLGLTRLLLTQSDNAIYEANPVANIILETHGWSGLTLFKLGSVALISSIILYVGSVRPLTGRRLLTFACSLMSAVVLYSAYLVSQFVCAIPCS